MSRRIIPLLALVLSGVALAIAGAGGCDDEVAPARPASIVISGDTGPWIVPCGCASNQAGGMPRRGTFLSQLRGTDDVLYLDAGGAAAGTTAYFLEKFRAILQGESEMGVAVHNLAPAEMKFGAERLRSLASETGVRFVSANATPTGSDAFERVVITDVGTRRIAIVGVVSTTYPTPGWTITDPRQAVLSAIASLQDPYDALVVLAYVPETELQTLATTLPEADAVIGGPTGQAISPKRVGPSLVGSATNKGKYLVRLNLPTDHAAPWTGDVVELGSAFADDPAQTRVIKTYLSRLDSLDIPAAETGLVTAVTDAPDDFRIAGSASCATCHTADDKVWHVSKHAHAVDALRPSGFNVDAYCLSCHTTGFALPGGFVSPKQTADRLGVGCESCHGPSQAHVENPKTRTPYAAFDQCIRCHDQENSPRFERNSYWARIAHGKAAALQEASK